MNIADLQRGRGCVGCANVIVGGSQPIVIGGGPHDGALENNEVGFASLWLHREMRQQSGNDLRGDEYCRWSRSAGIFASKTTATGRRHGPRSMTWGPRDAARERSRSRIRHACVNDEGGRQRVLPCFRGNGRCCAGDSCASRRRPERLEARRRPAHGHYCGDSADLPLSKEEWDQARERCTIRCGFRRRVLASGE